MPIATLRWSDLQHQPGKSGQLAWDVIADSLADAEASVSVSSGDTFPLDNTITAEQPEAVNNGGPFFWKVTARYSAGDNSKPATQDKPKFEWTGSIVSEAVDRDVDGNPLLNTAGDVFEGATEEYSDLGFVITKRETAYDLDKAKYFDRSINDAEVTFLGKYKFPEKTLRLMSYIPVGEYFADTPFVTCKYTFGVRWDTWRYRFINKGNRGWREAGTANGLDKTDFTDKDANKLSDVLLDRNGEPLDTRILVGTRPAKANPAGFPKGAVFEVGDAATFLIYKKFFTRDYRKLGL